MLCKAGELSCLSSDPAWRNVVFRYKLNGVDTSITLPEVLITYESLLRDLYPEASAKKTVTGFIFWSAQCAYMKAQEGYEGYRKWKQTLRGRGIITVGSTDIQSAVISGIRECLEIYSHAVHAVMPATNTVVVMGHTHGPTIQHMPGFKYVNSGGWATTGKDFKYSYVDIYSDRLILHTWRKGQSWTEKLEKL